MREKHVGPRPYFLEQMAWKRLQSVMNIQVRGPNLLKLVLAHPHLPRIDNLNILRQESYSLFSADTIKVTQASLDQLPVVWVEEYLRYLLEDSVWVYEDAKALGKEIVLLVWRPIQKQYLIKVKCHLQVEISFQIFAI